MKSWSVVSALMEAGMEMVYHLGEEVDRCGRRARQAAVQRATSHVRPIAPRENYDFLADNKADIVLSGGRTQFIALKAKMPWLNINQERVYPYAGYDGMVELVKRIALSIHDPIWAQVREPAPWDDEGRLTGGVAAVVPAPVDQPNDHFLAHHRKKFVGADESDMAEC